jgi:hypothetical protein
MEPQTLVALRQRMMEHHAKREYVAVKGRTPEQQERIERVSQSNARTQRLIGWLTFFRLPGDAGIGDTAHRLNKRSCKSPDAHALLTRLLTMCSCSRADAVVRLNKEHPYE